MPLPLSVPRVDAGQYPVAREIDDIQGSSSFREYEQLVLRGVDRKRHWARIDWEGLHHCRGREIGYSDTRGHLVCDADRVAV